MGTDEKIRTLLQKTTGDIPAFEGSLEHVVARAGIRRWRKRAAGAGVAVVLLAGVALSLGQLYGLRSHNTQVGTATTSATPSPSTSPSPPPPGWVRHTDSSGI